MNTMKIDVFGKECDLFTRINTYAEGGGLAIELFYTEGDNAIYRFSMLTVNLVDLPKKSPYAFVDTNNFTDAVYLIETYHLGVFTGNFGASGFCWYPEFKFNLNELNKYSIEQFKEVL